MRLLPRLVFLTLVLASTPVAAKSMRACADLPGHDLSVATVHRGTPCLSGADSAPIQQGRDVAAQCSAAPAYEDASLVALHRSIRDGGLGVLRPPANGYGANPIVANRSDPARCRAG